MKKNKFVLRHNEIIEDTKRKKMIAEKGIMYLAGICPLVFNDRKDVSECMLRIGNYTEKAYKNYKSISSAEYNKKLNKIVLNIKKRKKRKKNK